MDSDTRQDWKKQAYFDIYKNIKGYASHKWTHYPFIYDQIFEPYLNLGKPLCLLEIGVQNGGSLETWEKYLPPGSEIHGMDINPKCLELNFDENIHFHPGNAADELFVHKLFSDKSFDVIIDDGSHLCNEVIATFLHLFKKLNPGGVYIIEDLHTSYWEAFGGGLYNKNSSIEFFKQIIDALNAYHIPTKQLLNHADFAPLLELCYSEVASISFFDSICSITRFGKTKSTPFSTMINGNVFKVASENSFNNRLNDKLKDIENARLMYSIPNAPLNQNTPQLVPMAAQGIRFGENLPGEPFQIYTAAQASAFQRQWQRRIDYIRFEWVSLPDSPQKELSIDLTLCSEDGQHSFVILAILVKEDTLYFPSILREWDKEKIEYLTQTIHQEIQKNFQPFERRACHPQPRFSEKLTDERSIPGLDLYITVIHHLRRYAFIADMIRPGRVMECACGAGYGAAMLSRLEQIDQYNGVDLSSDAVFVARGYCQDKRFSFHATDLAEFTPEQYENVISLETIEHVPNPYRFIELLIDRMTPDGQLFLSLPAEKWAGSHLSPFHFSNWNRKRLMAFLGQYFEDISVFSQKLSLLAPSTFEASPIADRPPDEEQDEDFVCVLRQPRKKKRPGIVLKRLEAIGDVIWATPVLKELRRSYPLHNVIAWTKKTEVFLRNPDADLVVNENYAPLPDDVVIDLDWSYEKNRDMHILHAYASASGLAPASLQPALYPSRAEIHACAARLLDHFQHQGIARLIAVHMAATSPDRIWPKAHWQRFITELLQRDAQAGIVMLGHAQDFSADDAGFSANGRVLCLVRQLPLLNTAAMLSLCDLLVAPDSGLLHVAAAVSVPYLGLFGMADPETRLPFAAGSRALWANIECRGCLRDIPYGQLAICARGNAECMERILPEEALAAAAQILESTQPDRWAARCRIACPNHAIRNPSLATPRANPLAWGIDAFGKEAFDAATQYLSAAMAENPDNPLPYAYLAFIRARQGLAQEARKFIAQSVRLAPERADLVAALGETFLKSGKPIEAADSLREALQMQPDLFAAYPAFAQSLHLTGQSAEAVSALQTVCHLPSNSQTVIQSTLLQILAECGDLSEFTQNALRFSQGLPDDLLAARCLARFDESGEQFIETLSRIQGRLENVIHSGPSRAHAAPNESGLIRIAFMTGDFTQPCQFEELYALLRYLPPERFFTLLIFANTHPFKDDTPPMCSLLADTVLVIGNDKDDSAIEKLRALTPDILIDMNVCAPSERLAVFLAAPVAHKLLWGEAPCPPIAPDVQTLAGARLAVENMLPAVLLPEIGEVFDLPELPLTDKASRKTREAPVFGCLVPAAGIGRNGWRRFAETLRQHPSATLTINLEELGEAAEKFIAAQFSDAGIAPERLAFIQVRAAQDYCLAWQSIDLGLLPPVHPGGLALPTCLWMGRPCLVPASILPWSQRPAALLKALGKEEWIAADAPRYAELAHRLASPKRHAAPDPELRERMKALGLTDPRGFAQGFAEAMIGLLQSGDPADEPCQP